MCGDGRMAIAGGVASLAGGSLIGGGTLIGRVVLGCAVSFPPGANSLLRIDGSLEATASFAASFGVRMVNANRTQSSSDSIAVTGHAQLRGSVTTTWVWQGPQSLRLHAPIAFRIVTFGSSNANAVAAVAFTAIGMDAMALVRNATESAYVVAFAGCPDGFEGTYLCSACTSGRWSVRANGTLPLVCQDCGTGTYQDSAGQTACKVCGPGTMADTAGNSVCMPCAEGHYIAGHGATECLTCSPGWHSPVAGMSECVPCQPGYFATGNASSECLPCVPGTYQPSVNATACLTCDAHWVSTYAAVRCTDGRTEAPPPSRPLTTMAADAVPITTAQSRVPTTTPVP
jgi:hypothetical protein